MSSSPNLYILDVPDLVRVAVAAPIGNSDHSSLSAVISMAQAIQNLCVSRKVFLKHQANWNTVCGTIQDPPRRNIWSADNHVTVLTRICCCWLDVLFQPTSSILATTISIGLTINAGTLNFGIKQEALLRRTRDLSWINWEEFVHCQVKAIEYYSQAKHQFRVSLLISGCPLLSLLCWA